LIGIEQLNLALIEYPGFASHKVNTLRLFSSSSEELSFTEFAGVASIEGSIWRWLAPAISAEATTPSRPRLPQVSRTPASGSTLGS
jgi:hypothetical protein